MGHKGGFALIVLGLDHVQLAAPPGSEDEARRFFGSVLGWHEVPKPEALRPRGGVWFACGAHQVHIGIEADFHPARKAHPAFRVRDLDGLRRRLESAGIPVVDDARREEEGIRRFYASDPFGNRLEFIASP